MPLPRTLKGFNLFVDGNSFAGVVEEGTLPKVTLKTLEFEAGGMAAPVDISAGSVEKLEFDATIGEWNPTLISLIGHDDVPVTFRAAIGPANDPVVIETRCLIREMDPGNLKKGDNSTLKLAFTATYYRMAIDGVDAVEIDAVNNIFKSGGKDHTAGIRSALGL